MTVHIVTDVWKAIGDGKRVIVLQSLLYRSNESVFAMIGERVMPRRRNLMAPLAEPIIHDPSVRENTDNLRRFFLNGALLAHIKSNSFPGGSFTNVRNQHFDKTFSTMAAEISPETGGV